MIKRFNPDFSLSISHELAYMRETPEGGYADYRDYATLFSELEVVKADRDALAVENQGLKAGPQGFFAYSSECGYEEFDTAEKAIAYAEDEIADFRGNACDGWSDEVGSVVWGIVMQRATMVDLHDATEDDGCDPAIKQCCDYALLPAIETPATDAALAAVRAQAVEDAVKQVLSVDTIASTVVIAHLLRAYAAELREAK